MTEGDHPDPQGPPPAERLFGRSGEVARLTAGLEAASAGRGGAFLVEGEAGIGKTRLAEQLSRVARERGARVSWGRAWDGEGASAYWPWIEILRGQLHDTTGREALSSLGASARVLSLLDPDLVGEPEGAAEPWRLDDAQGRFRLYDALTRLFEEISRRTPVVLVLDDLQAADPSSLLLLEHLAARLQDARVLLVATRRDGVGEAGTTDVRAGAALAPFEAVRLAGLGADDVARFVEALTGIVPPAATVRMLVERTNGNPFFLDEAVRVLAAERALGASAASPTIPPRVHVTIGDRLRRLPPEALAALRLAAVLGQEFDVAVLEEASGVPPGGLAAILAAAERAGFLTAVAGEERRRAFVHGLVREVLEADLPAARKAELHAAAARVLEGELARRPSAGVARVAHHWYHAIPAAGPAKALEYARAAGDAAMAIAAYEDAEALYARALEVLRASKADAADECDLLVLLGRARQRAGDHRRALETFSGAAGLARAARDRERFARAALGYVTTRAETGHPDAATVALLEEALENAAPVSPALRTRLIARLAIARYFRGDLAAADRLSLEALRAARRAGTPEALAAAWNARHFALWGSADLEARLEIAANVARQAERAGDADLGLDGRLWKITDLLEARRFEEVGREIEALDALAERLRLPAYRWARLVARSMWTCAAGRLDESERLANEALETGLEIGEENASQFHGIQVSMVRSFQKRFGELEAPVRAFVDLYPGVSAWRAALALLYADSGQLDPARTHFDLLAANDFADVPPDGTWLGTIAPITRTCWLLEDAKRARVLRELLRPHRHRGVVQALGASYNGPIEFFYAMMCALAGDWSEAETVFERLAAASPERGSVPVNAISLIDYARSILRYAPEPDTRRVRELLDRANGLFRRCRMEGWLEDGERLRRALDHAEATGGDLRSLGRVVAERPVVRRLWSRDGEAWRIGRPERPLRFDDAHGFHYVAALLGAPRTPVEVSVLYSLTKEGPAPDPERARIYVTRALRRVRERIAKDDPALGAHLAASIRTGARCVYEPSGDLEVLWDLGP